MSATAPRSPQGAGAAAAGGNFISWSVDDDLQPATLDSGELAALTHAFTKQSGGVHFVNTRGFPSIVDALAQTLLAANVNAPSAVLRRVLRVAVNADAPARVSLMDFLRVAALLKAVARGPQPDEYADDEAGADAGGARTADAGAPLVSWAGSAPRPQRRGSVLRRTASSSSLHDSRQASMTDIAHSPGEAGTSSTDTSFVVGPAFVDSPGDSAADATSTTNQLSPEMRRVVRNARLSPVRDHFGMSASPAQLFTSIRVPRQRTRRFQLSDSVVDRLHEQHGFLETPPPVDISSAVTAKRLDDIMHSHVAVIERHRRFPAASASAAGSAIGFAAGNSTIGGRGDASVIGGGASHASSPLHSTANSAGDAAGHPASRSPTRTVNYGVAPTPFQAFRFEPPLKRYVVGLPLFVHGRPVPVAIRDAEEARRIAAVRSGAIKAAGRSRARCRTCTPDMRPSRFDIASQRGTTGAASPIGGGSRSGGVARSLASTSPAVSPSLKASVYGERWFGGSP
jgi:hypothetical protein